MHIFLNLLDTDNFCSILCTFVDFFQYLILLLSMLISPNIIRVFCMFVDCAE